MAMRNFLSIILLLLCKELIRIQHISDRYTFTVLRKQNYFEKSWQSLKVCSCIPSLIYLVDLTVRIKIEYRTFWGRIKLLILGIQPALPPHTQRSYVWPSAENAYDWLIAYSTYGNR